MVVTFAHHGVALPSPFAARAIVPEDAGLGLARNQAAATAFPIAFAYW